MLAMRPSCECCDKDLPPDAADAMICTFECTFCRDCVETRLGGRCPNCGEGKLFRAFLKVNEKCPACGEELFHHRADDLPAYLVIVVVGHIVVPLALAIETSFAPPILLQLAIYLPLTLALSFNWEMMRLRCFKSHTSTSMIISVKSGAVRTMERL